MSIQKGMTWPLRILVLVVGGLVVLGGLAARDFEDNAALGRVPGSEEGVTEEGKWVVWEVVESDYQYESEAVSDAIDVVYAIPDDGEMRTEVFRGSPEAAHAFIIGQTRVVVFEGTQAERDVWVEEHYDAQVDMTAPNAAIGIGALLIVTALIIGRRPMAPTPDQPRALLPH